MKSIPQLAVLSLCASLTGCASAYLDYPCGCVEYGYCPPPPLAYTAYSGCPSPLAALYSPPPVPIDVAHFLSAPKGQQHVSPGQRPGLSEKHGAQSPERAQQ
jgi:hypothetical protein